MLRFLFKLRDIDEIEPWGKPGSKSLSWFGLTDGAYCIETTAGRLLEHTDAIDPGLGEPWCDYQVARLFEDLITLWPKVCEPIPSDIRNRYFAWRDNECEWIKKAENTEFFDVWHEANWWFTERQLDFSYLRVKPSLHLWRVGPNIQLRWRAQPPWLPAAATLSIPFEIACRNVSSFFQEFLAAMNRRVALIEHEGWRRKDCAIDIRRLVAEQVERTEEAAIDFSLTWKTDWDLIRRRLNELGV
jgi:hypothetical protein